MPEKTCKHGLPKDKCPRHNKAKHCKCCVSDRAREHKEEVERKARWEYLKNTHERYSCDPWTTCEKCR